MDLFHSESTCYDTNAYIRHVKSPDLGGSLPTKSIKIIHFTHNLPLKFAKFEHLPTTRKEPPSDQLCELHRSDICTHTHARALTHTHTHTYIYIY